MLSLIKLVEEAVLLYQKTEHGLVAKLHSLLTTHDAALTDEILATRITTLKTESELYAEADASFKVLLNLLFIAAQTCLKKWTPETAREEIENRIASFQTIFKSSQDCSFLFKAYDYVCEIRIHGFQRFIKQVSAENAELNTEVQKLNTHLNTAKASLEKFQQAYEFETREYYAALPLSQKKLALNLA